MSEPTDRAEQAEVAALLARADAGERARKEVAKAISTFLREENDDA